MRILWLCNVIIPEVAVKLNINAGTGGGWINQLSDIFDKREDIELCIIAPYIQGKELTHIIFGNNSEFYGFQKKILVPWKYDTSVERVFRWIIREFNPDIVHIFGTEFPHSLAMIRSFNNPNKTVIHIQGVISAIAKHYEAFLPYSVTKKYSFRDFIKKDNIISQKKNFIKRGKYEIEAIKKANHIFHRTEWDEAVLREINNEANLHYVQEMIREQFYSGEWKYEDCEKYSIFVSQGNYPLKGLHIILEALRKVKERYENIMLYVAGDDILQITSFKDRIREGYYSKYIRNLIIKWGLTAHVKFTGPLDAENMKKRYLQSHIFVSASSIENSSNSIAEAMLLGVPLIASFVGGCSSLIKHKENGLLYQADEPCMLSYYICKIFENKDMAIEISKKEKLRAKELYDRVKIVEGVIETYKEMLD